MDNEFLTPTISEQARSLCEQISVAHNLDDDIQEELFTHIEDKMLGYLSGEVPLTEDDAFILVREHFGDIATIKSLLHDVHIEEVTLSQARRRTAVVMMTLLSMVTFSALMSLFTLGLYYFRIARMTESEVALAQEDIGLLYGIGNSSAFVSMIVHFAFLALIMLGPWVFLYRWKRASGELRNRWFYRWSGAQLTLGVVALLTLNSIIPKFQPMWAYIYTSPGVYVVMALIFLFYAAQCVMWIWWCDSAPRSRRNVLNSSLLWLLYHVTMQMVVPKTTGRVITESAMEIPPDLASQWNFGVLHNGPLFDTPFIAQITWFVTPPNHALSSLPMVMYNALPCMLAYIAYRLYQGARDKNA